MTAAELAALNGRGKPTEHGASLQPTPLLHPARRRRGQALRNRGKPTNEQVKKKRRVNKNEKEQGNRGKKEIPHSHEVSHAAAAASAVAAVASAAVAVGAAPTALALSQLPLSWRAWPCPGDANFLWPACACCSTPDWPQLQRASPCPKPAPCPSHRHEGTGALKATWMRKMRKKKQMRKEEPKWKRGAAKTERACALGCGDGEA